jgi:hypothetical protein
MQCIGSAVSTTLVNIVLPVGDRYLPAQPLYLHWTIEMRG